MKLKTILKDILAPFQNVFRHTPPPMCKQTTLIDPIPQDLRAEKLTVFRVIKAENIDLS